MMTALCNKLLLTVGVICQRRCVSVMPTRHAAGKAPISPVLGFVYVLTFLYAHCANLEYRLKTTRPEVYGKVLLYKV